MRQPGWKDDLRKRQITASITLRAQRLLESPVSIEELLTVASQEFSEYTVSSWTKYASSVEQLRKWAVWNLTDWFYFTSRPLPWDLSEPEPHITLISF